MKAKTAVVLATVAAGSLLFVTTGKGKPFQVPAYSVARVIDGDTFETAEKQLIRLSGFAPKLRHKRPDIQKPAAARESFQLYDSLFGGF